MKIKNTIKGIMLGVLCAGAFEVSAQCGGDQMCAPNLEKYTLLRSYKIDLPERKSKMERPEEVMFPVVLSKGNRYRISGCPNKSESSTDMIYSLLLGTQLISTNYNKDGDNYAAFEFICNKTGVYYFKAYFVEGAKGCGSASLAMTK